MNLGNKLAVGEAVDPGIESGIDEVPTPEIAIPEPARPVPAAVAVVASEEPVPAHAER